MRRFRSELLVIAAFLLVFGAAAVGDASSTAPASAPAVARSRPSEAEIRRAVRRLNHPLRARRREAIRQLAEWGPLAFDELRRAARGPDLEAAILAKDLLAELESAILLGADVHLSIDKARVAWDEPFTLTVRAASPVAKEMRVPWPKPREPTASQPVHIDARQVAAVMDAGDFLIVTGPEGDRVDVRVESINRDPEVFAVIDERAGETPPSHVVPAGQAARLEIREFNRGWARYPMLAEGVYTIAFAYQPQWRDPSWTENGFGRVEAEPVKVEITRGAPEAIRNAKREVALHLAERDGDLLVELKSTWDRPVWINGHLGSELDVHGRLEWRFRPGGGNDDPVTLEPPATSPELDPARIHRMEPGGRHLLGKVTIEELQKRLRRDGYRLGGQIELTARYVHVAGTAKLKQRLKERDVEVDLPKHIYTGVVTSPPIEIKLAE